MPSRSFAYLSLVVILVLVSTLALQPQVAASIEASREYSDYDNLLEGSVAMGGSHTDTHVSDDYYYVVMGSATSKDADDELIYETELNPSMLEDIAVHFEGSGFYANGGEPLELTLYIWDYVDSLWYELGTIKRIFDDFIDWTHSQDTGAASIANYMNTTGQMKLRWYTRRSQGSLTYERCDEAYIEVAYTRPESPVAIFTYSPEDPAVNEVVTFNASSSYDLDGTIDNYLWDFGDGTNGSNMITNHTFTSAGTYNVTLTVIDNESYDNSTSHMITVYAHDVTIVSVTPSATEVDAGQVVNISVVVRNEGSFTETFNLILYYDNTAIGTRTVTNLEPGAERTLEFMWDTTDAVPDVSYTIKAEVSIVAGEIDTVDNTCTYDTLRVKSQVTSEPLDWSPILPYLIPILLGALGFSVAGIAWRKREVGQGFEFFNEITGGGIPPACSAMIIGDPKSGKSILCQQLVHDYLTRGKACIYVAYDSFPEAVRGTMKGFHWDMSAYEEKGKFKLVDCYSSVAGIASQEKHQVGQPFDLSDMSTAISTAMKKMKRKSPRVFLDSTAPLFASLAPLQVTKFLQDCSAKIKRSKGIFFFTVKRGSVQSSIRRRLEEIVDCVIELDVYEGGGKTWKRMSVRKLRRRRVADAWIPFKIKFKKGITFLPPEGWSEK